MKSEVDINEVNADLEFIKRIEETRQYPIKLHEVIEEEVCRRVKEDLRRLIIK